MSFNERFESNNHLHQQGTSYYSRKASSTSLEQIDFKVLKPEDTTTEHEPPYIFAGLGNAEDLVIFGHSIDVEKVLATPNTTASLPVGSKKNQLNSVDRLANSSDFCRAQDYTLPLADITPTVQLLDLSDKTPIGTNTFSSDDCKSPQATNQYSNIFKDTPLPEPASWLIENTDQGKESIWELPRIDTPNDSDVEENDLFKDSTTNISSLGEAILSGVDVFPDADETVNTVNKSIVDYLGSAEPKDLYGQAVKFELRCKVQLHQELLNESSDNLSSPEITVPHVDDPQELETQRRIRNREHAKRSRDKAKAEREMIQQEHTELAEMQKQLEKDTKVIKSQVKTMGTWLDSHKSCALQKQITRPIETVMEETDSHPIRLMPHTTYSIDIGHICNRKCAPAPYKHKKGLAPGFLQRSVSTPGPFLNNAKTFYTSGQPFTTSVNWGEAADEYKYHATTSHPRKHADVGVTLPRRRTKSEPAQCMDRGWENEKCKKRIHLSHSLMKTVKSPLGTQKAKTTNSMPVGEVKLETQLKRKNDHFDAELTYLVSTGLGNRNDKNVSLPGETFARKKGSPLRLYLPRTFHSTEAISFGHDNKNPSHVHKRPLLDESTSKTSRMEQVLSPPYPETSAKNEWILNADIFQSGNLDETKRSPWEVSGEHPEPHCFSPTSPLSPNPCFSLTTTLSPRIHGLNFSSSSPTDSFDERLLPLPYDTS